MSKSNCAGKFCFTCSPSQSPTPQPPNPHYERHLHCKILHSTTWGIVSRLFILKLLMPLCIWFFRITTNVCFIHSLGSLIHSLSWALRLWFYIFNNIWRYLLIIKYDLKAYCNQLWGRDFYIFTLYRHSIFKTLNFQLTVCRQFANENVGNLFLLNDITRESSDFRKRLANGHILAASHDRL